eukprot:scaffold88016_cov39-Phaeocystis_antarctica.AAC.3
MVGAASRYLYSPPDWIFLPLSNLEFLRFLVCATWVGAPVRCCAEGGAWRTRRSRARAGRQWLCAGREQRRGARGEAHRANLAGLPYLGRLARHPRRLPPISTRRSARAAGGARVTAAR